MTTEQNLTKFINKQAHDLSTIKYKQCNKTEAYLFTSNIYTAGAQSMVPLVLELVEALESCHMNTLPERKAGPLTCLDIISIDARAALDNLNEKIGGGDENN